MPSAETQRQRRADWLAENGPCVKCGSGDQLEVDHVDRSTKAMEPYIIWKLSAPKREHELAKCQVLCRPCHLIKTSVESTRYTAAERLERKRASDRRRYDRQIEGKRQLNTKYHRKDS